MVPAGLKQIEDLFSQLIKISVAAGFVLLVVMLVYGGIRFLVSGGEAKNLKPASETITWALLGIIFLILAWLILLLIKSFTGVDVTTFNVGTLCVKDAAGNINLSKCIP